MVKRRKLNVVRKSGKSQAKTQLIDSSNEVNHGRNEECAQFGVDTFTSENPIVASLNHQNYQSQSEQQVPVGSQVESHISFGGMSGSVHKDTILRRKRSNAVRKGSKSLAKKKQLVDTSNEVNQNNHITEEFAQFEGDTRENLMLASLNHQNDISQSEQQIHVGSHVEYPISFGRVGNNLPKDTMGRQTRLGVRNSVKAQAREQLIHSSNEVNRNIIINESCAHCGGGTRENLMVASLNNQNDKSQSKHQIQLGSLPEDTIGSRIRFKAVRKNGKAHAKEQLIDSSDIVNQNSHHINEKCAQFGGDTRENLMVAIPSHQNHETQSEQQIQVGSRAVYPISFGTMGKSIPKDTKGRQKRSSAVRRSGKAQAEEQFIDSSNAVNQNNHNINENCAHFGRVSTRRNLMVASLNLQNDQSGSEQVQVGSHVESPLSFGRMSKSLTKDTMGRHTRSNAVRKSGKAQAEEEVIDRSNAVNQSYHNINETCAQLGGVSTRRSLTAASLNLQNDQSQSEQVQGGSHVESTISFGRMSKRLTKDTMGRHTRLNAVKKSGKAQPEEQFIDSSNAVNQNNNNINEVHAQLEGVSTRGHLMVASLNHQNDQSKQVQVGIHEESPISFGRMSKRLPKDTTERNKRESAIRKRGKFQAEKQLIDSSIEVNQNNHNVHDEGDHFVGDTRGNPMLTSPNHQSDQSQSEQQIPVESHVETPNSFGKVRKSLTKGQKRVRGYTRMSEVWDLPDGEFICVEVDSLGNPIGWEGKKLLNALGCLVRKHQYAPINILSWKDMPELNITNMLQLIQSKFHFVPELTEQTKQILKDNLSAKWRQFKHDLKAKGYDENKTEEEMAANIPDRRVDPSQYRALVHHWCSQKGQKISNINKRNRSKYEDLHCMGTKNLSRFIHETTEANGVQPSRAQIYIQTRTRKDGSIVTDKAANVIGELKKHMGEATSSRTLQTTQDSTNWQNDVYSKVRGPERRGSVRCLGKIPRHSNALVQRANVENRVNKLENLLGNLVSVLQTRFSADQQINDVLQAIAQEVPNAPSTPNDSFSNDQQTTSDSNWEY